MLRRLTLLICSVALLAAGCSKGNDRQAAGSAPTAPSALASAMTAGSPLGAASGPMVFTGTRPDALEFRKALDGEKDQLRRIAEVDGRAANRLWKAGGRKAGGGHQNAAVVLKDITERVSRLEASLQDRLRVGPRP